MKARAVVLLLAALLASSSWAIFTPPLDAIPFCRVVTDGYTTDSHGKIFNYGEVMCFENGTMYWELAYAVYFNGQNTGLNASWAFMDYNYFDLDYYRNGTSYEGPGNGIIWDLGPDDCYLGTGIIDGTFDTVDGALSILFDGVQYGGDVRANFTTTCSSTTSSFTIGPDFLPKGLSVTRTFYFPPGPVEAWGRVVDEVTNPQQWDVEVSIGYHNNVGSDEYTHFFNVTDRYTYSGDDAEHDNLVSFHFASINSSIPLGFFDLTGNKPPLLTDGNDDIGPYWNVTIPAGKTMTFMMIMNQGGLRTEENEAMTYAAAMEIDSNPLKIYAEMTDDQLKTLYNFNPCATVVPQLNNPTPSKACTQYLGEADFDLSEYLVMTPLGTTVTLHNDDGSVAATSEGTTLSVTKGTYTVKINFGLCTINAGSVTVTCPDAPETPQATPVASNTPSATPTRKTSSAVTLIGSAVALTVAALLF